MADGQGNWGRPVPLGQGGASEAAHFVAAPLLAGACIATVGVLGADAEKFRWPGPAMLLLTLAFAALVGSVQYGFHARRHLYSPADVETWHPPDSFRPSGELLRREQRRHFGEWLRLSRRAALTYNLGIALLGAGGALALAAPEGASFWHAACRWAASAVLAAGALAELEWTLREWWTRRALLRAARAGGGEDGRGEAGRREDRREGRDV
ncbi:hypothetical protein [Streptomyces pini]|uniref:Uncharacterized protein n=1 Tax=Streptomyces pini TaxID=1520580 RepID=A0A1I3ZNT9_9ACTN|nr:hypothetical protein [Streptomyces pini]SFK45306.1 hypothetical protein SAMN05192584_10690 [Streptomyces pini]